MIELNILVFACGVSYMHEIVTSDWFLFITGLCSIVGLLLSIFATTKVIKIGHKLNIKNQNIIVNGNENSTAGGNNGII
ncbi:MAG TPA: hypothetical protein ENN33_06760 [Ignavibacteria bacterium]|nr:hypothetical protein [Ignavibacteria bacterium]